MYRGTLALLQQPAVHQATHTFALVKEFTLQLNGVFMLPTLCESAAVAAAGVAILAYLATSV
jgi:hypothetical protein